MSASLIDLPTEILTRIFEELGGRELRRDRGSERLAVCRRWYDIARPIYHSGLNMSRIHLYGYNLHALSGEYGSAGSRRLMHKNTRRLKVRLLGHWWDEATAIYFETADDSEAEDATTPDHNEPSLPFFTPAGEVAMQQWRDETLRPSLDELFCDLKHFSALEQLTFEASSESSADAEIAPRWDYVYYSSISVLLQNLPILHNLSSLTLDICGSKLVDEHAGDHLCESLADIVPRIENVFLRMSRICPTVLRVKGIAPGSVKIRKLTIKLNLPAFRDTNSFWVEHCPEDGVHGSNDDLLHPMAHASQSFLAEISTLRSGDPCQQNLMSAEKDTTPLVGASTYHGMTGFRMTYADPVYPDTLITLDCLTLRVLLVPEEFFAYEDDGTPCWFELDGKDSERLLEQDAFVLSDV